MGSSPFDTAILDVDGTLIDSNYHHAIAWARAFSDLGHDVPIWTIHRSIGMGGDRLVAAVTDQDVEDRDGDAVRDAWKSHYDRILHEIVPFDGAIELLAELRSREIQVVLASSGIPEHTAYARELLGGEEYLDAWTTGEDADESKPSPELLNRALEKVGGERPFVIGDSVWDMLAARQREIPSLGLLCGGFSRSELTDSGATLVRHDPRTVVTDLDDVLDALHHG